jgi:anti-sigma factor RsiW
MTGESTESTRETALPELDEREVLFNAYLDGELSEERKTAFDERLENDPEFREAYDEFAEIVGTVRDLPYEFAPDDFTDKVRDRVRRRSRGGFFSDHFLRHQRAPYEVVAVVMFVVMASAYLFFLIPSNRDIESADENRLEVPSRPEGEAGGDREAEIDE